MEKLDFRVRSSLAKSIGTMVSVAGALMVTLYKGPTIAFDTWPDNLHNELIKSLQADWVTGGFLLAAGSFCLALLWIVQVTLPVLTKCLLVLSLQPPKTLPEIEVFHIFRPGLLRTTLGS